MWWLTNYVLPMVSGLVFACVGAVLLFQLVRACFQTAAGEPDAAESDSKQNSFLAKCMRGLRGLLAVAWVGCLGSAFLIVGLFVGVSLLLGPGPADRAAYVNALLNAAPGEITSIRIGPHESQAYPSLVSKEIVITDRDSISAICSALHEAEPSSLKSSREIWNCTLKLVTAGSSHGCEVLHSSNNGCLLSIYSDGEWWQSYYGQFRTDALAKSLEEAVRKHSRGARQAHDRRGEGQGAIVSRQRR